MPTVDTKPAQSGIPRTLLASGLGAIFGFQSLRLARYGFSLPWYVAISLFLSQGLLGFSIGASTGAAPWWKRGMMLGMVVTFPAAFAVFLLGRHWLPYGLAIWAGGVAGGIIIAVVTEAIFPRAARPLVPPRVVRKSPEKVGLNALRRRLAEEGDRLSDLDIERVRRRDPVFGKTTENRIIWSELLDLELQDIDERVQRIRSSAGSQLTQNSPRQDS